MKFYECRFAPSADTPRAAIHVSQNVVRDGETVYECFQPQAFSNAGVRASDVAILLDHEPSKRAGTATALVVHGDWHIASFVLDGPYAPRAAEWIERSGRVSLGFDPIEYDPVMATRTSLQHPVYQWFIRAGLDEISICSPGGVALYAGAKVTAVREFKAPMAPSPNTTKRAMRREGRDYVVDLPDGSAILYSARGYREALRDGTLGVR